MREEVYALAVNFAGHIAFFFVGATDDDRGRGVIELRNDKFAVPWLFAELWRITSAHRVVIDDGDVTAGSLLEVLVIEPATHELVEVEVGGSIRSTHLTTVNLLHWLQQQEGRVADDRKEKLKSEIEALQRSTFAKGRSNLELEQITKAWSQQKIKEHRPLAKSSNIGSAARPGPPKKLIEPREERGFAIRNPQSDTPSRDFGQSSTEQ